MNLADTVATIRAIDGATATVVLTDGTTATGTVCGSTTFYFGLKPGWTSTADFSRDRVTMAGELRLRFTDVADIRDIGPTPAPGHRFAP